MSVNEFEIIRRYFTRPAAIDSGVVLGVGDDAAIVRIGGDQELVIAADVVNEGIHFPVNTSAQAVGHKALAVNLSDLAAMGADPAWFTMTISLPQADEQWLGQFASGLFNLADQFGISLIGGDTVRGPLSIAINALGRVPVGAALRRSGAVVGDQIFVSGTLGDAACALQQIHHDPDNVDPALRQRLDFPTPRVELGRRLRGMANACIDISDGLAADLSHILDASRVGAVLHIDRIPVSAEAASADARASLILAMTGGDDYELCFTVPPVYAETINQVSKEAGVSLTCVGEIVAEPGLIMVDSDNQRVSLGHLGHDHFAQGI